MKKLLCIFTIMLTLCLPSCSSDSDEPQSGLFDWRITKMVFEQTSGKSECVLQENETLYKKTEEYVLAQKALYEAQSNKVYRYKYAYKKIK